jgi:HTH-type transcriptional regulator/antitoxin HigA
MAMAQRKYKYDPDYAVHPGAILEEYLETQGLSQAEFARRCGRSAKLISEIISGKAPIEPKTAMEFENVLGLKAYTWLEMETKYRLSVARRDVIASAQQDIDWMKNFPVRELKVRNLISTADSSAETVLEILSFFGVASRSAWESRYAFQTLKFRQSESFTSNDFALKTWLRIGELQAESLNCAEYNEVDFKAATRRIRDLTIKPFDLALETAINLCCGSGVALVITKPVTGVKVHGVARWLLPKRPIIQLSARHLRDDQLWFSFFHEAAHLLLHSKTKAFLDGDEAPQNDEEREANEFASNLLIKGRDWARFIETNPTSKNAVTDFAREQNIAPGIVVGRLQHEGIIPFKNLNSLKVKLKWPSDQASP